MWGGFLNSFKGITLLTLVSWISCAAEFSQELSLIKYICQFTDAYYHSLKAQNQLSSHVTEDSADVQIKTDIQKYLTAFLFLPCDYNFNANIPHSYSYCSSVNV